MKYVFLNKVSLVFLTSLLIIGCKSNSSKNISRGTGWQINSDEGGFQYNTNFKEQETAPGLIFIEGGTFTMGRVQDDVMHDWNNTPNQQHVQSFYMDETEVTNKMYLEYLDWIKQVYPPSEERFRAIYESALPDTLVWRSELSYNEVMVNNYLRHPGYAEYPVVGVSWIQAVNYANWRTDRVNELALEKEGYLKQDARLNEVNAETLFNTETYINAPEKTYGGNEDIIFPDGGQGNKNLITDADGNQRNKYATRQSGIIQPKYRLPTEAEWEYAALALSSNREYNAYRGRKKYPWDGQYTRSGKRDTQGEHLANFKQGKGDYGGIAGWPDDLADITAPVKSFRANDFGLYDMAGNVAEWVADVYRPIVDDELSDFNYYRGNVYTKNKIGVDGKVNVIGVNEIVYDTLSNGKLVPRTLPGQIESVPIDENETYLRTNFSRSDNRNFNDGDKISSRTVNEFGEDVTQEDYTQSMYNSPVHLIEKDSLGNIIRIRDSSTKRTSLINDEVRVYKGGSWKDREYWLDPAQRRFYPQYLATDFIGFRCAMSRIGSKFKGKERTRN